MSDTAPATQYLPTGFSEAGICVQDLAPWLELFTELGDWEISWQGRALAGTLQLWGLGQEVQAKECLLSKPGQASGRIRLFWLEGVEQKVIRDQSETWDSGGIFDLDIRVKELYPFVEPMQRRDWAGISEPVDWRFGELEVREWLTRGPDDVILALIQRIAPPLEGWDDLRGFSHIFNSSQIVHDMDTAIGFYQALGFKIFVDHAGPLANRGGEVLGLDPRIAPKTPVRLVIMQPQGKLEGSVELVSFENPEEKGRNLAGWADPWNFGLNLLRFPVPNLDAYMQHLAQQGIPLAAGPISATLAPGGETRFIALRTPDGAWLEFYQARNKTDNEAS